MVLVTHIFKQYKFENVNVITENVCERERGKVEISDLNPLKFF